MAREQAAQPQVAKAGAGELLVARLPAAVALQEPPGGTVVHLLKQVAG